MISSETGSTETELTDSEPRLEGGPALPDGLDEDGVHGLLQRRDRLRRRVAPLVLGRVHDEVAQREAEPARAAAPPDVDVPGTLGALQIEAL